MSDVIAEGDAGQSAQIGRNRAIDINNRPPGVDIETLKQSNPDTNRALDWFESRLESLQREKAALQSLADTAGMDAERAITRADKAELDLKCLQESTVDAKAYQALQRENEELRRIASEKHDEVLALEAAAITPEMRERIGAHRARLENPNTQLRQWTLAADQIFSDLLGEQG